MPLATALAVSALCSAPARAQNVRLARPISAQPDEAAAAYRLGRGPVRRLPERVFQGALRHSADSLGLSSRRGLVYYTDGPALRLSEADMATAIVTELRRRRLDPENGSRVSLFEYVVSRDDSYAAQSLATANGVVRALEAELREEAGGRAAHDPVEESLQIAFLIRDRLITIRYMIERIETRWRREAEGSEARERVWDPLRSAIYGAARRELVEIDWRVKRLGFYAPERAALMSSVVVDSLMAFNVTEDRRIEGLRAMFDGAERGFALSAMASRFFERMALWVHDRFVDTSANWSMRVGTGALIVSSVSAGAPPPDAIPQAAFWGSIGAAWVRQWIDRYAPSASWAGGIGALIDRMASGLATATRVRGERRGPLSDAVEARLLGAARDSAAGPDAEDGVDAFSSATRAWSCSAYMANDPRSRR